MLKKIFDSQTGAAALIASMIVAIGLLSIVLSTTIIAINNKNSLESFTQNINNFYNAEIGMQESLLQVKNDPNNLTFGNLTLGKSTIASQFVESANGACDPAVECVFTPGSGWWGEYFNWSEDHPDMQVDPYPGPTPTPTQHDWFDDIYKTHEQLDSSLIFHLTAWFPYDGTQWENKEGYSHDYFFGLHWRAQVTAPAAGNYGYNLASDDDSWVTLNGIVVVNNSGTHASFTKTGNIFLSAGINLVDVYFAERHTVDSGFRFSFDNPSLIITPYPEACNQAAECKSNIETNASSTKSSRKIRYTCDNDMSNCVWSELVP